MWLLIIMEAKETPSPTIFQFAASFSQINMKFKVRSKHLSIDI